MKHALVIGGTGMLARASVWLAENGYHVSVVGRDSQKMQRMIDLNPAQLTPVLIDYTNTEAFAAQLKDIQQQRGPVCLVLAWIHSDGEDVIPCLMDSLPTDSDWKLFHVNGSSSNLKRIKARTIVPSHVHYHQIQLGFQLENGVSRWLTHKEISDGVIKAVQEEKIRHIVGTLSPWDKRP